MTAVYDYIVVGSGAGGATVAKELSRAGKHVLLLEKGREMAPGTESKAYSVIRSGIEIWLAECLGGTTTVSMGNAVRSRIGKRLEPYFEEAERELGVVQMPLDRMGPVSRQIMELSDEWILMPKCIEFSKCQSCGSCAYGCLHGAKWSSKRYLTVAESSGCKIMTGLSVEKVLMENGRSVGVKVWGGGSFRSKAVILSAGAIETPRILLRSGLDAGMGLFVDTYTTIGGLKKGANFNKEVGMPFYMIRDGHLISPHFSSFLWNLMRNTVIDATPSDIVGLMVKIRDAPAGIVRMETVEKFSTESDLNELDKGRKDAKNLLLELGVEERTMVEVHPRGAHPGGTCSELVRSPEEVETEVEGLFISDASVIPGPFGLPPMLTVIAISKRLASSLLGRT